MKLILSAFGMLLLTAASGFGQLYCNSFQIRGTYSVKCEGLLTPVPSAQMVSVTSLGMIRSNDTGTMFTGTSTVIAGGVMSKQELSGPAAVNSDCTGTMTFATKTDTVTTPITNLIFHVISGGDKLSALAVDPGTQVSCTLTRISNAN